MFACKCAAQVSPWQQQVGSQIARPHVYTDHTFMSVERFLFAVIGPDEAYLVVSHGAS